MARFLRIELRFFVIGVALGLGLFLTLMALPNLSWVSLGTVPGKPIELIERYPYIQVRTSDDALYICEDRNAATKSCQPKDAVVEGEHFLKGSCGDPMPLIGSSFKAAASLSFRVCTIHEEDRYDVYIAALEDGTIQAARRKVGSPLFGVFFLGGLGGLIGLMLGFFYFVGSALLGRHTQVKDKNDFKHQQP